MISPGRALAPYAGVVGAIALVGFAIDVPALWIPLLAFGFAAFVMVETQQRGVVSYHKGWWVRPTVFAAIGTLVVALLWLAGSPGRLVRLESVLVLGMFWVTMPWSLFGPWAKYYGYALLLVAVVAAFVSGLGAGYYALAVGGGSLLYSLVLRFSRA
ncbi:MAG TPA: hypothetical protein VNJ51_12090 [Candidatus Dormibacteraeota bacterium]|nr:hypothetical protein [Candidatus Dormibacteraeota bacterium]